MSFIIHHLSSYLIYITYILFLSFKSAFPLSAFANNGILEHTFNSTHKGNCILSLKEI